MEMQDKKKNFKKFFFFYIHLYVSRKSQLNYVFPIDMQHIWSKEFRISMYFQETIKSISFH